MVGEWDNSPEFDGPRNVSRFISRSRNAIGLRKAAAVRLKAKPLHGDGRSKERGFQNLKILEARTVNKRKNFKNLSFYLKFLWSPLFS
jgi:hypothetical protein